MLVLILYKTYVLRTYVNSFRLRFRAGAFSPEIILPLNITRYLYTLRNRVKHLKPTKSIIYSTSLLLILPAITGRRCANCLEKADTKNAFRVNGYF